MDSLRLGTDSDEYEILGRAAKMVANHKGLSMELGLREGGGSQWMIENYDTPKTHIAVDPYGSLPYEWQQNTIADWVYDNNMRNHALASLYTLTLNTPVNFLFFNLTDTEFFNRFRDGVPLFLDGAMSKETLYSIVHFDAVHSLQAIFRELNFFFPRTSTGSIFVFDDIIGFYDHDRVEALMFSQRWKVLEKGIKKASYIRDF